MVGFRNTECLVTLVGCFRGLEVAKASLQLLMQLGFLGEMINSRSEARGVQSGTACCAKK